MANFVLVYVGVGAFIVFHKHIYIFKALGGIAQWATCLTRYVSNCRSRDRKSILAWSHNFVEIDHEIISTAILLPSADSRRVVVIYKRKYVHEVMVNHLVKLTWEKSVVR